MLSIFWLDSFKLILLKTCFSETEITLVSSSWRENTTLLFITRFIPIPVFHFEFDFDSFYIEIKSKLQLKIWTKSYVGRKCQI